MIRFSIPWPVPVVPCDYVHLFLFSPIIFAIKYVFTSSLLIFVDGALYDDAARSLADESVLHIYRAVFCSVPGVSFNQCILCIKCHNIQYKSNPIKKSSV